MGHVNPELDRRQFREGTDNFLAGRELVISPRTVSTHVQHIRLKLGASNVANAVYLAMVAQNT